MSAALVRLVTAHLYWMIIFMPASCFTCMKRQGRRNTAWPSAVNRFRDTLPDVNRNSSGGFWHKGRYQNQMWCDGQYMALPFLIHYGTLMDDMEYCAEESHFQVTLLASHAQADNGLLFHAWDESKEASWADPVTGLSPEFWGRGLGWYSMALVEMLDYFPFGDPRYIEIL